MAPGPIRFQDLSTLSGGPLDLGAPRSTVEKASCAFLDADGDGWDDFVSLTGAGEPALYFLNRPDGAGGRAFVPAPAGNGLDTGRVLARDKSCICAGDVDADGDVDLFIGTGWNPGIGAGLGDDVLLLNDGTGRFADATAAVGISDGDNTTAAALFFDMDLDGDLDLFVSNSDFAEAGKSGDAKAHLWRNELAETGVLRFADEAPARGITDSGPGLGIWCATGVDYDGDGDGDVLVGHDGGDLTRLFANDGTGHFTDVTVQSSSGEGDDQPGGSPSTFGDDAPFAMGFAWGDVENDGDLDLYVTNIQFNPLYRNHGDGTFAEVGLRSGVRANWVTWGCSFADFDLDGFVDLYVAGGDLWDQAHAPIQSYLFRNLGDGTFADETSTANLRRDVPLHRENGTACADFDGDGRIDLLAARAERAGASPYVYRNETETAGRRWLAVAPRGNGVTSSTSAIGARVRVVPRDASGAAVAGLAQLREVTGGDSRGAQSSFVQHFGLGDAAVAADVVVTWPRQGTLAERTQTYRDVPLDRRVTLHDEPRAPTWAPDVAAAATVLDGRVTTIPCAGSGAPDPLVALAVASGPSWVAARGWDAGRTVTVDAPVVGAAQDHEVRIVATAPGSGAPATEQTLTLRVVPAPRVDAVRRGARALTLTGLHLDLRGLTATVDGVPCKVRRLASVGRGKAKRSRLQVRLPKALAATLRTGAHAVEVHDPAAAVSSMREFGVAAD